MWGRKGPWGCPCCPQQCPAPNPVCSMLCFPGTAHRRRCPLHKCWSQLGLGLINPMATDSLPLPWLLLVPKVPFIQAPLSLDKHIFSTILTRSHCAAHTNSGKFFVPGEVRDVLEISTNLTPLPCHVTAIPCSLNQENTERKGCSRRKEFSWV